MDDVIASIGRLNRDDDVVVFTQSAVHVYQKQIKHYLTIVHLFFKSNIFSPTYSLQGIVLTSAYWTRCPNQIQKWYPKMYLFLRGIKIKKFHWQSLNGISKAWNKTKMYFDRRCSPLQTDRCQGRSVWRKSPFWKDAGETNRTRGLGVAPCQISPSFPRLTLCVTFYRLAYLSLVAIIHCVF